MSKPRVVKDFDKLDTSIQEQIKLNYPIGFSRHLVKFKNAQGDMVSALPFETEEKYYLVRMSIEKAKAIIAADDDYDEDGRLRDEVREDYEDKYEDELEADEIGDEEIDPDDIVDPDSI
ncbi:MAG: hypothetical protein AAF741_17085 [Bacteroidota bacterium]